MRWGAYDSLFKPVYVKYKKYEMLNDRDLRMNLKVNTMDDQNYDQIENFIEYERYLNKSYFAACQKQVNQEYEWFKNANVASE